MTYIAFLRGINSGKNPSTRMADLRKLFMRVGMKNVKTILASGNVKFDSNLTEIDELKDLLEKSFAKELKWRISSQTGGGVIE